MNKKVAWIPVCINSGDGPQSKGILGPWPHWIETSKKKCAEGVRAVGFKFKIVPVFVSIRAEKRRKP